MLTYKSQREDYFTCINFIKLTFDLLKNIPKIFYWTIWLTKRETKPEIEDKSFSNSYVSTRIQTFEREIHVNATGYVESRDN